MSNKTRPAKKPVAAYYPWIVQDNSPNLPFLYHTRDILPAIRHLPRALFGIIRFNCINRYFTRLRDAATAIYASSDNHILS